MPVTTKIGRAVGHRHHVPEAGRNVAVAAGTQVRLVCLVGLDEPGLGIIPKIAHSRASGRRHLVWLA